MFIFQPPKNNSLASSNNVINMMASVSTAKYAIANLLFISLTSWRQPERRRPGCLRFLSAPIFLNNYNGIGKIAALSFSSLWFQQFYTQYCNVVVTDQAPQPYKARRYPGYYEHRQPLTIRAG